MRRLTRLPGGAWLRSGVPDYRSSVCHSSTVLPSRSRLRWPGRAWASSSSSSSSGSSTSFSEERDEKVDGEGEEDDGGGWFGERGQQREKKSQAAAKPRSLFEKTRQVAESELEEKFIKGGGPGGQKINKTNSCVYLKHLPTGLEVKCQEQRERGRNRVIARRILHEKLMQLYFPEDSKTFKRQEKIRRRKQRMGRRYGRNEPLLPVSTTTTTDDDEHDDDGDGDASESSADGPRQTSSAAAADTAQSSSAGPDGAGEVAGEKQTKRRRTVDPASFPDFVWEQLGIRRSSVVECTEFDPEDFSTDDEDEDDDVGEEDEDVKDKGEAGGTAQPRPGEKPMTDFVLEQLGVKPDQGKK